MILRGEDLQQGEAILKSGKKLGVADIGTLAALGTTEVLVFARPVVGIISTGDELVAPGERLKPGQIRDVNSDMLKAAVEQLNGISLSKGIVEDKYDALKDACKILISKVDVLLVSGGTSVGEKDNMPRIVAELGEMLVHGLAVKPGKPTIIGEVEGKPVFGLPGNPVAAFFIFGTKHKLADLQSLAVRWGVAREETAYAGDDIPDIECIEWAGLGMAPANARREVRESADWTSAISGGSGAIRDCAEYILKLNGAKS